MMMTMMTRVGCHWGSRENLKGYIVDFGEGKLDIAIAYTNIL